MHAVASAQQQLLLARLLARGCADGTSCVRSPSARAVHAAASWLVWWWGVCASRPPPLSRVAVCGCCGGAASCCACKRRCGSCLCCSSSVGVCACACVFQGVTQLTQCIHLTRVCAFLLMVWQGRQLSGCHARILECPTRACMDASAGEAAAPRRAVCACRARREVPPSVRVALRGR
jgi:hypothetical protein